MVNNSFGGPPPSPDEDEILRRLRELEEAERFRIRNFGIEGYIPNAKQYRAHRSEARTILYSGGNRAGKSHFGAAELCFHLTKRYPDWYPQSRRCSGPIKAAVSATEFPIITRVIEPKIRSLLPSDYYKVKKTAQGYWQRMECKDGSTVDFLTLEMKDEAYESADWDFVWCDEPQDQTKYYAMRRGLIDRDGQMIITFTPLTQPWMKEELVDKADGKIIDCFRVDIRDNLKDMTGNPILSEKAVQTFEDSLPDDLKETRIKGEFFHLRGIVYKEFGDAHVLDNMKYDGGNPVICVLDPHDRLPHHVIWAFIDSEDDINVDYELSVHCELPDLAHRIKAVEKVRKYNMKRRLIDPNFGRRPSKPGAYTTVIQELAKNGAAFYEGNDDVELGHMVTREYLHWDTKRELSATNKPKLFFSKQQCPITIRSMRNLQYEEWKGQTKNERDPKEAPKQKETHGADCVRYLTITRPRYKGYRRTDDEGPEESPY